MIDLDEKLDEAITSSLSIRKAGSNETEKDAPNKYQWFRPNGGELWFFEFDNTAVKQAFMDAGWIPPTDQYALSENYQKRRHALRTIQSAPVKTYTCENLCGVISTSDEHECYKCGGKLTGG